MIVLLRHEKPLKTENTGGDMAVAAVVVVVVIIDVETSMEEVLLFQNHQSKWARNMR